jgi:hypothetical protein
MLISKGNLSNNIKKGGRGHEPFNPNLGSLDRHVSDSVFFATAPGARVVQGAKRGLEKRGNV